MICDWWIWLVGSDMSDICQKQATKTIEKPHHWGTHIKNVCEDCYKQSIRAGWKDHTPRKYDEDAAREQREIEEDMNRQYNHNGRLIWR